MKISNLLVLLTLGIISCKDNSNCSPEISRSTWSINKTILIEYNSENQQNRYSILEGDNRLFEYNHSAAQCENIYDDEWGEVLTFAIPNEITDFKYEDDNILETRCFYTQYGAWVRQNHYEIKNGMIKGEKKSENEWIITVSVATTPLFADEQPKLIEFVEIFTD